MEKFERADRCIDLYVRGSFSTAWYNTSVDVYGKHLSGLLLIKRMNNDSYRVVFTSEAGVSLFDFEFAGNAFSVKRIIKQLDRKPVIDILRKDFSLLIGLPFDDDVESFRKNDERLFAVAAKSETAYTITDLECNSLQRLEIGSKRKAKVTMHLSGSRFQPEKVKIVHHTFDMVINLKKIERE